MQTSHQVAKSPYRQPRPYRRLTPEFGWIRRYLVPALAVEWFGVLVNAGRGDWLWAAYWLCIAGLYVAVYRHALTLEDTTS